MSQVAVSYLEPISSCMHVPTEGKSKTTAAEKDRWESHY
jgi:hypothetical protein